MIIDSLLTTKTSDTSVIGSSLLGAFIAGPTGAVVGAIYAADKNQKNRTSK